MQGGSASAGEVRSQGVVGEHRPPHPRGEFDDASCRVLADALQDVDEVGLGVDALESAGHEQTLDDAHALTLTPPRPDRTLANREASACRMGTSNAQFGPVKLLEHVGRSVGASRIIG